VTQFSDKVPLEDDMKRNLMAKRVLVPLAGVGAGLYPLLSCALGLGEIQVESRLDQPLRARIEIFGVSDEEDARIRARLPLDDSRGDGAASAGLLRSLKLSVETDASHRYFVVVSSAEVVTEPLFDLPVEVAERTLQVARNYSVLLDPAPLDDGSPAARLAAATSASEASGGAVVGAAVAARPAETAVATTSARGGIESYAAARRQYGSQVTGKADSARETTVYVVSRSDTLRRIVRRLGARTAAERARLANWIYQHNAAAFRGSMRHLRVGVKLTLPEGVGQKTQIAGSHVGQGGGQAAASSVATSGRALAGSRRTGAAAVVGAQAALGAGVGTGVDARTGADARTGVASAAQLEGELATLQQMLAKLQATISAQDTQIADLTRRIAATSQVPSEQSQPVALPERRAAESKADAPGFWLRPGTYFAIGAVGVIAAILGLLVARLRKARASREAFVPAAARTPETGHVATTLPRPAVVSASNLAQGSGDTYRRGGLSGNEVVHGYEVQHGHLAAHVSGSTEETEELQALDPDATARIGATGKRTRPDPALLALAADRKLEMQPDGSITNKEIIKLLERSLNSEPHRIDIQLKLLEVYQQEALGSLGNFQSLLHKVEADLRVLSPAQRAHLEMLQRAVADGKAGSAAGRGVVAF
jgi:Tfp pilus assembly protein FimV